LFFLIFFRERGWFSLGSQMRGGYLGEEAVEEAAVRYNGYALLGPLRQPPEHT
jgi:hypothetical protein